MIRLFFLLGLLHLLCMAGYGQDNYARQQVNRLSKALHQYERMNAEEWMYFSCDSCVRPGQNSPLIRLLRKDLLLTGDLSNSDNVNSDTLDNNLENALRQFQRRHGLEDDGILGPETLDELNTPLSVRLTQLRTNIEHWSKFSDSLTESFVLVNIPGFSLSVIDSGKVTHSMKVIVGRLTNPTPIVHSEIYAVVLHPSWVIPNSIATKEIVPMLRNDPAYLNRNHMKVYTYSRGKKKEVSADSIDWHIISTKDLKYHFEQIPGKWNALGELKFLFKNEHDVYLHDTPDKHLFFHPKRTYSHGCVRVENPVELAAWLLHKNPSEVIRLIRSGEESTTIPVLKPIPVFIDEFTSWVNDEGLLQFRKDVYN